MDDYIRHAHFWILKPHIHQHQSLIGIHNFLVPHCMVPYKWQARKGCWSWSCRWPTVSWRSSNDLGIYGRKADCCLRIARQTWVNYLRLAHAVWWSFDFLYLRSEEGFLECLTREFHRLKTTSNKLRKLSYMVFASRSYSYTFFSVSLKYLK